jgi:IMP dehydrogenase/GMP reductase
MRIINDVQLDFEDVLIMPKRSTLKSRSEVEVTRTFNFGNSNQEWTGVPIMVSNMDTTGTFNMAQALFKYKIITCIHKHYTLDEWKDFLTNIEEDHFNYFTVSIGITDQDIKLLSDIMALDNRIRFICVDVANGYTENFIEKVKKIRLMFPAKIIIAGNVVSAEITEELVISGVDIVKAGIGGGCLRKNTQVLMANMTYKNINQIVKDDMVINMHGKPVKVLNVINQGMKKTIKLRTTNQDDDIVVTPDHLFWVYHKTSKTYSWLAISEVDPENMMLTTTNMENNYDHHNITKISSIDDSVMEETWDIEVDCDTHSFIANDSIVHNSVCTTRIKTGVGRPQLSTIIECADSAHGLKGCVVSDGGCKNSGDIAKAFAAGADFVMLGGMMAGHNESAGDVIEENGVTYKEFYGMSSDRAMLKHRGEVAKYRASEGKRVLIKYRGPVENTINDILGGIRSTCTYVGASKLKELSKRTTFVRVNKQSNEVFGKN